MDGTGILIVGVIAWVGSACLGAWIAHQKHREPGEGFMLGLFLGLIGLFIELLLPTKPVARRTSSNFDLIVTPRWDMLGVSPDPHSVSIIDAIRNGPAPEENPFEPVPPPRQLRIRNR